MKKTHLNPKKNHFLLVFLFSFCYFGFSQEIKNQITRDSIYHDIHDLSKKSKFNKFIYKLLFRSSALKLVSNPTSKAQKKNIKTTKYNGKIIRKITIETLDPFGYSLTDTLKLPKQTSEKTGNSLHLKTKKFIIKKLLLFSENQLSDSLLVQESERLIRQQRFVRQVKISPEFLSHTSDSIDIKIRVLDSWSLIPTGSLSSNRSSVKLTERNLFGFGHQISGEVKNQFSSKLQSFEAAYKINNILNTYMQFDMEYKKEFNNDSRQRVSINRPFYSVFARNAGGISFEKTAITEQYPLNDSLVFSNVKFEFQEYWFARAFKIGNKKDAFSNLIIAATYNFRNYLQTPGLLLDPSEFTSSEKNTITYIGFSKQKFYQDRFIFNFNITEDVPYGQNLVFVLGQQNKNFQNRFYTGIAMAHGKKYPFGYLSSLLEWGSFFNNGHTEQTAFKLIATYFSPLLSLGNWQLRQFLKPTLLIGSNRDTSFKDQLTLHDNYGIEGFSNKVFGTSKWLLSWQTQTYMPGNWYGFRFSPFFNTTMGALASKKQLFSSKVYSKFTIGFQINNDYLVFNNFQISFSFYPEIPFEGNDILKTNSFDNSDLNLYNFQLNKPAFVGYQN